MARVRVGDEDVHGLFRPGGSVQDIERPDESGRTRFNLETGLQFANQAMRSPALGVGANLLGRGLTALGRSIKQDGSMDMNALRQQAAARLAAAGPGIAAGNQAVADNRADQAARDAQANGILGTTAASSLGNAPFGSSMMLGQPRPMTMLDAARNGSSPGSQYMPEGAEPLSQDLQARMAEEQRAGRMPPRPQLPDIDYNRPFFSEEDMNRHKELRKHLTTAASPAEAIRIAHEMHAHQDKMAGVPALSGAEALYPPLDWEKRFPARSPVAPSAPAPVGAVAPVAAPQGADPTLTARKAEIERQIDAMYRQGGRLGPQQAKQFDDLRQELDLLNQETASPAPAPAPAPQVVMAQTPVGEVPVVRHDDRTLTMRDPETGGMLHIEMGPDGRPIIKQRFSREEMLQLAQQAEQPQAPTAGPQMTQMSARERAAEMLRAGLERQPSGGAPTEEVASAPAPMAAPPRQLLPRGPIDRD